MKRILSHFKPFIVMLIVAIALLFVQSFADLRLPNYMSDIVNVGIQQSGIEHASPDQISQDGFAFIKSLAPEKDQQFLKEAYVLSEGHLHRKLDVDRQELDQIFGDAVWTLLSLAEENEDATAVDMSQEIDLEKLYALTPLLESMDISQAQKTAAAMEPSLKEQTAAFFAQLFYEELGIDLENLQSQYILRTGVQMMGITMVGMLATIAVSFLASKIGAGFSQRLRRDVFAKIESFSSAEFENFSSSSLVVRTTNDVNQIQQIILMGIRMFFYAPIMAIGGVIMILERGASMTWIILLAVLAISLLLLFIFITAVPKFKIMQKFIDRVNLVFREQLNGVMVIRAFANHDFENERFDKANLDRADLALSINRITSLMMPLMMFIMNVTMLAIIWFGSREISEGLLQIGDMMAFMQYTMQIIFSFLMISMMFIFIPRALVSMNRIAEVLNQENKILDPEESLDFVKSEYGTVEFEDVSFSYDGAQECVLENISFKAPAGQTTAIIGSTGSGKSSLVNLIPRFFDVTSGSVKVHGVDVRQVAQEQLRQQIAYVPQQGVLLSGTAYDNLIYGRPDASEADVYQALEIAQADFVLKEEKGLEMPIAQGGNNVSGGQKQRLSIARAIVKDAPIFIFDDSFSALDFQTDRKLRAALNKELAEATIIVVAQRVNTIMDADQILVMDEGRLVAQGSHHELLKTSPTYYEIASSQLTEEELAYD